MTVQQDTPILNPVLARSVIDDRKVLLESADILV